MPAAAAAAAAPLSEPPAQAWRAMQKTGREIYERLLTCSVEDILDDSELLLVVSVGAFFYTTQGKSRSETLKKAELEAMGKGFEKLLHQLSELILLSEQQTLRLITDAFKTSTHEQDSKVAVILADQTNPTSAADIKAKTIAFYFEDRLYRTRSQELLLTRLYGDPDPERFQRAADSTLGEADPLDLDALHQAWETAEDAWDAAADAAAKEDADKAGRTSRDYRVDSKWLEISSGKTGSTVVSIGEKTIDDIAKAVGHGCKIVYDKSDKGLLKISAKGQEAIKRAILGVDAATAAQKVTRARQTFTEAQILAHNVLAQYTTNPLLKQLNPPRHSMTHDAKRLKSETKKKSGAAGAAGADGFEEGSQNWLSPAEREQWVEQILLEKEACIRTLVVYIGSDLYNPALENSDDAGLDNGTDEPQPQVLNCIIHLFSSRFDPFNGAPVDRANKRIAPLYDRVCFFETIVGLQVLDVPLMLHDKLVGPESVDRYLETFLYFEELLQGACIERDDERMAPLMLAWGAFLRKLAPPEREPRVPVGVNPFWDDVRHFGGEYHDWAGFVNCGLRVKGGRPFDLLLRCMDRENVRCFVEHLNTDDPADVLIEDIVVSTVYQYVGILCEVLDLPVECPDIAIQQSIIKLLTHVYGRHFVWEEWRRLGRMALDPWQVQVHFDKGNTAGAEAESLPAQGGGGVPKLPPALPGLVAHSSTLISTFWQYAEDPTDPTLSDGVVEFVFRIIAYAEQAFPAQGWATIFIKLMAILSGFAHVESAIDEATRPADILFEYGSLERAVTKIGALQHYGFLYEPEDRQRPAREFVLGDRAKGVIEDFPMRLMMMRHTKAFSWRVPIPSDGQILLSIKDGDAYAYQLTSLNFEYSGWEYFAVCLLNMQKALRAGPDADNIGVEQEEQCIAIINMIRCLYNSRTNFLDIEAEVRRFFLNGLDEKRWGMAPLPVSVGNHSATPLLELVLVICRYSTKDQAPLPKVGAACIACISAAANTAPAEVCRSLATSQFEAYTQWPGSFKDAVLDDVLPADRRTEDYSATLWCLRLIKSLVRHLAEITHRRVGSVVVDANRHPAWHDIYGEMREYMGFLAQILVEFESIRSEKVRQKGQIGALLFQTFMHILGEVQPGTILEKLNEDLRQDLHADAKYNNKGQARALVELLTKGHKQIAPEALRHRGRSQWVHLLRLAFRVLRKVLDQPPPNPADAIRSRSGLTQLQELLLVEQFETPVEDRLPHSGYQGDVRATSFVVSVADYLALNRDRVPPELPTAAIHVLRRVLEFSSSHSISGTINELNRVECRECKLGLPRGDAQTKSGEQCIQCHLHKLFWLRLEERTANRPRELAEAILQCITACIRTQTGLAQRLLDLTRPTSVEKKERALLISQPSKKASPETKKKRAPLQLGSRSCLVEVLKIIESQGKRANSFLGQRPRVPAAAALLIREMWRRSLGTEILRNQSKTNVPKMKLRFWAAFIQPLEFRKKCLSELAQSSQVTKDCLNVLAIENAGTGFKEGVEYNIVDTDGVIVGAKVYVERTTRKGEVLDLKLSRPGSGWGSHIVSCSIDSSGVSAASMMEVEGAGALSRVPSRTVCKFAVRCDFVDSKDAYLRWHYQSLAQAAVLDVLTMEAWRNGGGEPKQSPNVEVAGLRKANVGWLIDDGVLPFCGDRKEQDAFAMALQHEKYVDAQVELVTQWRRFVTLATAGVGTERSTRQPCYGVPDFPALDMAAGSSSAVRAELEQQANRAMAKQAELLLGLVGKVASALKVVVGQLVDGEWRLPPRSLKGTLQMSHELAELLLVLTTRASAAGVHSAIGESVLANLASVLSFLPGGENKTMDTLRIFVQSTVVTAVSKFWRSARGHNPVLGAQTKAGEILGHITAYLKDNLHFRNIPAGAAGLSATWGRAGSGPSASGSIMGRATVTPVNSAIATLEAILKQMTAGQKESIALRVFSRSGILETLMMQMSQCLSTMTDVYFTRKALLLLLQLVGGAVDDVPGDRGAASKSATRRCAHVVNLSRVSGGGYRGVTVGGPSGGGFAEHMIAGTRNLQMKAATLSASGRLNPYIVGRRNPWHSQWCLSLLVFTNALRTLGRTDSMLEDAILFTKVHKHTFMAALAVLPLFDGRKVTAGELDEAAAIMMFLSELTRYPEFLRSSPDLLLADGGIADAVLRMLKGCVYLVGRGSLEELCEWVSPDDGERPSPLSRRNSSRSSSRSQFFLDMEERAHSLARASLTFLKNISMPPAATWSMSIGMVSLMTSADLVAQYRLFAPFDIADPDDPHTVSLDTLVDYLMACRALVRRGVSEDVEAALTYGAEVAAIVIISQGTYHLNAGERDPKSWASNLHRVYDCFFSRTSNRGGSSSRGSLSSRPSTLSGSISPNLSRTPRGGQPPLIDDVTYLFRQSDDGTIVDLIRRLREVCEQHQ